MCMQISTHICGIIVGKWGDQLQILIKKSKIIIVEVWAIITIDMSVSVCPFELVSANDINEEIRWFIPYYYQLKENEYNYRKELLRGSTFSMRTLWPFKEYRLVFAHLPHSADILSLSYLANKNISGVFQAEKTAYISFLWQVNQNTKIYVERN